MLTRWPNLVPPIFLLTLVTISYVFAQGDLADPTKGLEGALKGLDPARLEAAEKCDWKQTNHIRQLLQPVRRLSFHSMTHFCY